MKFVVDSVSQEPTCKMRIGQISDVRRIPNAVFLTPLLLLYSKGGSVAHLTREVLEKVTNISTQGIHIPLSNSAQCYKGVKHFQQGIAKFVGLPECLTYCTAQDPAETTKEGYNTKNDISIWTQTGRKQLTPDKYMDMVEAFRPDMYHVLCDGDTNIQSSQKRIQKSMDGTTTMFRRCAERHSKSQVLANSSMLAVIEGGYSVKARKECATMFSRQPFVDGFVIDGLHNNGLPVEQMSYETIRPVITETLKHLPQDKLRVVHGGWRPDVVLELVNAGVDMFDSSLAYFATERGCALNFNYKIVSTKDKYREETGDSHFNNHGINGDSKCNGETLDKVCETQSQMNHNNKGITNAITKSKECIDDGAKCSEKTLDKGCETQNNYQINLNDKIYFDDLTPILEGCSCLACTQHTRSYIHHLLNTREMLASVLLMIHNLHHYQEFFHAIREHGKKGQQLTIDPPLT